MTDSKQGLAIKQIKKKSTNSLENIIGEILGLLEEREKSKEWILEELKRKKVKLKVAPTANTYQILCVTPKKVVNHIYSLLKGDDLAVADVKTLSKTFHWFFTDIISSADPKMNIKAQARKIRTFNEITKNTKTFKNRDPKSTIIHWTGDGMALGFSDSPEKPLQLAIELHRSLAKHNENSAKKNRIYIRIGMNTGDIFFIEDVEGHQAFWGDGIVMARRVMDLCGQNQIFASENIANGLRKLSHQNQSIIHPIGEYEIKHDEDISLYNIYGKDFGNKKTPKFGRVKRLRPYEMVESNSADFRFNEVEIILDVKNPKTMMTHHTWIWKVQNLRKDKDLPLSEIYYPISGDIPKEFSELNLKIRDNYGNRLKISNIITNKPTEKEFNVNLKKPIKYKQKQTLFLEYDWEETVRKYEYLLSTECEKLKYKLTLPKEMDLKNRILKVNPGTNAKIKAEPSAIIRYSKDKTNVIWQSEKKLKEYSKFVFEW